MFTPLGNTHSGTRLGSLLSVLLVEEDEERAVLAARVLQSRVPDLHLLQARSVDDARQAVDRCDVDLIITQHVLPDGTSADICRIASGEPDAIPVVAYVEGSRAEAEHVWHECPDLLDCAVAERDGTHVTRVPVQYLLAIARAKRSSDAMSATRTTDALRRVRHTISRVNHDLNNPLSIISGNAQLLVELANALELDGDLAQPIHDIEEASARVSGILRRLLDLKDQLPVDDEFSGDVRAELRDLETERQEGR